MPPKMKVPDGELTAPELRKLIRAHNILVSIKIPKGTDRLGLIKLIEGKGFRVNHKDKKIVDARKDRPRRPVVTLKNAVELTKPKPVSEEEKKKRQQARQKKKGEKAFLKVAIPKAPPVSKKTTKVIKVGKPPPKAPPKAKTPAKNITEWEKLKKMPLFKEYMKRYMGDYDGSYQEKLDFVENNIFNKGLSTVKKFIEYIPKAMPAKKD
jgi:hypothetical protein